MTLYSKGISIIENSWLNTNQVGLKPVDVNKQCDFTESSYIMHLFLFYTGVVVQFKTTKILECLHCRMIANIRKQDSVWVWVSAQLNFHISKLWRARHMWDSEMPTKMISGLEIRAPEEEFKELLSLSLRKDGNSRMWKTIVKKISKMNQCVKIIIG